MSLAFRQAVDSAVKDPEVIVIAFRNRFDQPQEENDVKTTVNIDDKTRSHLQKLSEMTKLPVEQVMRLCMEAYIQRQ